LRLSEIAEGKIKHKSAKMVGINHTGIGVVHAGAMPDGVCTVP